MLLTRRGLRVNRRQRGGQGDEPGAADASGALGSEHRHRQDLIRKGTFWG